ncbi:alpha-2-macroglobulin [Allofranklinella schreckenbergeri]|uniref:Alpha-2-macroglobulin n=2 Tax=Allofranklinella schreckenbergeri TaxID=1076744 RepID=A0A3M6QHW0_9BURK|nr:alpha-2-macroglobulin [Allofranklinella schreckenbergeri]
MKQKKMVADSSRPPFERFGHLPAVRAALGACAAAFSMLAAGFWGGSAYAAQPVSITPSGSVSEPAQVVVTFAQDAVAFGRPQVAAPVQVQCVGGEAAGEGRWLSPRQWAWAFKQPLPAGVACTVTADAAFRDLQGHPITLAAPQHFNTGGPQVQRIEPWGEELSSNLPWNQLEKDPWMQGVDEEQRFLVQFSAPVDAASLPRHVHCEAEDVGERIPVRVLDAQERQQLLALQWEGGEQGPAQTIVGLACQRRLSAGVAMKLVLGKGVRALSGLSSESAQTFYYRVREPFEAVFQCEREKASSPCSPLRPMQLRFSAPLDMRWLEHIQLRAGERVWQGVALEGDASDSEAGTSVQQWRDKPLPGRYFDTVRFAAPLPPNTAFELVLPADVQDEAGRALRNAASFPLKVATGGLPALAKFATGDFAVMERFAEGYHEPALLPVTLRAVEAPLPVKILKLDHDRDIMQWLARVQLFSPGGYIQRTRAQKLGVAVPARAASATGSQGDADDEDAIETRGLSLLSQAPGVTEQTLPARRDNAQRRETEVVGIALQPGFQVVEIASPTLGKALLDQAYGEQRVLHARTAVLVTNLMVHFKLGAENAMAWVTALDSGKPVAGARVQVNRCDGQVAAQGVTDGQGVARFEALPAQTTCSADESLLGSGYFISARTDDGDLGLVSTQWNRGIEPWRFDVHYDYGLDGEGPLLHTVLDRSLLRAGETLSMKHYARLPVLGGFAAPGEADLPQTAVVQHLGSGREFRLPLTWRRNASGGAAATSALELPPLAPLGEYAVHMQAFSAERHGGMQTAQFRVEEFRLPVLTGTITPVQPSPAQPTAEGGAPRAMEMNMHLGYVSGGAASHWPVQISAMLEDKPLHFAGYERYTFHAPQAVNRSPGEGQAQPEMPPSASLLLDKAPLQLDAQGQGRFTIPGLDQALGERPKDIRIEATFEDPNGEMQTLTHKQALWPTAALVGIHTDHWVSVKKPLSVRTIALTPQGQPLAGAAVQVRGRQHTTLSTRKRMVGGFYKYEHHHEVRDLGVLCQGQSGPTGRFDCVKELAESGEVELVAEIRDAAGRSFASATSVWVTREGELWFAGESSDRMDVLPEKPSYQPGETARFQVRMPYRQAQALVTVEREGIIETRVIELAGSDPSFTLKIDEAWGPNVYVSVLAVRGRLRDVPWYSFFTWGWRSPIVWWNAWRSDTGEAVPPTALVDLSKPSYRLGVALVRVGDEGHRIQVSVKPEKARYATGEQATLEIAARLPNGQPAAGAEVALAVVDQALLELAPNPSWDVLRAMMRTRPWGVRTATAQMEVVGRRHYGLKARAAGGGGGRSEGEGATRELFDTLLLWQPAVQLDAQGKARVQVPLNDSITTFHAEAIADAGLQFFGSGSGAIVVAQDVQLISGLPPVVRAGDAYDARITVRNTTAKAMNVQVQARHGAQTLEPRQVQIPAGASQTVQWRVTAPQPPAAQAEAQALWEVQASAEDPAQRDAMRISQKLLAAVPVTVRQATLRQLSEPLTLPTAWPDGALEGLGGIHLDAQASLAGDTLPGLRRWWQNYPYACLEQRHSKALGLMEPHMLQAVLADLPSYLDSDGLAAYFPIRGHGEQGNIALSAHLLSVDATLGQLGEADLRIDAAARDALLKALANVAEGRLGRQNTFGRHDRTVERLSVIAALAQHGQATPSMLESLKLAPQRLPTHALLDWLLILKNTQGLPGQAQQLRTVQQELRSRIVHTGTHIGFTTERSDDWWWVMQNGNTNAARLLLITADMPEWKQDAGGLASGLMARQKNGHWGTTTANLWGQLALRRFAQWHEATEVAGVLRARMGADVQEQTWPAQPAALGTTASKPVNTSTAKLHMAFDWPDAIARLGDAAASQLQVEHIGSGQPWITLSALAAVPSTQPVHSGLRVEKTIVPIVQTRPGQWSQGDIYRVHLVVHASAQTGMTALTDPIPAGSAILGSGLGRDSALATQGEDRQDRWSVAWEERKMDAMRVYYHGLHPGQTHYTYTVRLNQPGQFRLPPTHAEALYMPQVFGETPNADVTVLDLPRATP